MGIKGFERKLATLEERKRQLAAQYDAAYELSVTTPERINSEYWSKQLDKLAQRECAVTNKIHALWREIDASGLLA